jgi:hypothetical protein
VLAAALPGTTRLFLAGNAVAMTGNGLVIAFTLIYLHQARGSLSLARLSRTAELTLAAPILSSHRGSASAC